MEDRVSYDAWRWPAPGPCDSGAEVPPVGMVSALVLFLDGMISREVLDGFAI